MSKNSLIFILIFLLAFAVPNYAETLLASYESSETNLSVLTHTGIDPGLAVSWPVQGGVGGVPAATEGTSVLKMQWTSETDRKVEIEHQWSGFTFDLAGHERFLIDVYIDTSSAVPGNIGLWDFVFDWLGGFPIPPSTGEWITVSMDVSDFNDTGLSSLYAFVLSDLAGDDGTVYIDNLRIGDAKHINFSGHSWWVKNLHGGPGPCNFSDSNDIVWVDSNDQLHMTVKKVNGDWTCSEIINDDSLGYGTYAYTLQSRVDTIDPNIILGLFTWDTYAPDNNYTEIDFEFGRWRDPLNDNAQYVIQPWNTPGNIYRFDIDYSGPTEITTHIMNWRPDGIYFESYYGDFSLSPNPANIINSWLYTGGDNPPPSGENFRINFWLVLGLDPVVDTDHEFVISDFQFLSPCDINNDSNVDIKDFAALANEWLRDDCDASNDWCNGTEMTGDGTVDMFDIDVFLSCWLD